MNQTLKALIIKFLMTFVVAWISLGFIENNTLTWILIFSLIGAIVNYIIGDLFILPTFGNLVASLGDGIMGALVAYLLSTMTENLNVTLNSLVLLGALIAIGEYFFHKYLIKNDKVSP